MTIKHLISTALWVSVVSAQTLGPVLTKTFTPNSIAIGGQTSITLTLTNPNTRTPLTNVSFTDTLPVATFTFVGFTGATCDVASYAAASGLLTVDQSNLGAGAACTVVFAVRANAGGTVTNTTSAVTSREATGAAASAVLNVSLAALSAAKAFNPATVVVGQISVLTFTLTNPNAQAISGVAFSDTLPDGLSIAAFPAATPSCGGPTPSAPIGGSTFSITGATVAANSTCTINLPVLANGTAIGPLVNTSSTITSPNASPVPAMTATVNVIAGEAYQVHYASNLTVADSVVNISNSGANGASLNGPGFGTPAGNICTNIYAFSPDEQLVACCSCLITPGGLVSLSVRDSLRSNTLTGLTPNSMVIKMINTGAGAGFSGSSCAGSAAAAGSAVFPLAPGLSAWGTTVHVGPAGPVLTELAFRQATLSPGELASVRNRCSNIIGNGSGFGICRGCALGGRGAAGSIQ